MSGAPIPTRTAPWLSFNACALPAPLAASAPAFGPNRFLLGANLPWIRYGLDVGTSADTPDGGLHADPESAGLLDAALARLRRDGVEHARVFLFCDGRAGLRFGVDGTPLGLDSSVFPDVDLLLATAERHRIGLHLVLFDAGLLSPRAGVGGTAGGGRGELLRDPARRAALLERVIVPLLQHCGAHPAVEAWDLFDEPECATLGMACPNPVRPRGGGWGRLIGRAARALRTVGLLMPEAPTPALVDAFSMRAFLLEAVQAVHQYSRAMVTVGLASTANLALVKGLGLDFYTAHWWEQYGDAPLRRAVADLGLDRPLVLGAFPATTRNKSVKTVLDTARCAGYGGAFLWTVRGVDGRGSHDGQLAQWVRNHAEQLSHRPVHVEPAAAGVEPAAVAVPAAPSEAVAVAAAPLPDDSEDEGRRVSRAEPDVSMPGLAAAPA